MTSIATSNNSESGITDQADGAFKIDALTQGSVHVWHMELDKAECELESWHRALGSEERVRASSITREPVRRRFVIARGLLRSLLGRYLHTSAANLAFDLGEHGKPRLAGSEPDRGLVFNVSHSGDRLAIALAHEARLGADIECWRPLRDAAALASRCLGPSELADWNRLPESQQLAEFFRLWTLKEAFCKAVGRGIAMGLQNCVFDSAATPAKLLAWPSATGENDAGRWLFSEFGGSSEMSGAVAIDRPASSVRHFDFHRCRLPAGPAPEAN